VDLSSHIVRALFSLKVENVGSNVVSEVLLAFPNMQAKNLAAIKTLYNEGRGKVKATSVSLPTTVVEPEGMPPELTFYSVSLPKGLEKGGTVSLDVLAVFTHSLQPFPEEITQADGQLVVYQDSAYYLSPYTVKVQTLGIRLPGGRVESYTKFPNAKLVDSEITYGPFESLPAFSYSPVIVHFENNYPFAVAHELVREIEISHWGNVQITEHYNLVHGGAKTKGGFSRLIFRSFICYTFFFWDFLLESTSFLLSDALFKQLNKIKYSHLDIVGRPVVVLEKSNVVPEHNLYFQVQATVQQIQNIINQCLAVHDKLDASLRDLSRTGDVQSCKIARKTADAQLKELVKELKPLVTFLHHSPQASHIWPKVNLFFHIAMPTFVEELVAKEKDMQEKMFLKHSTVVDCFEKKLGGREIENRIASQQQKLAALRQEVDDLLEFLDEI
ncbi:hypothetical protein B296_00041229, partial [Ensete ventricosum]